jgi:hypothetical protein
MALKGYRLLRPSRRILEVERALRLDEAELTIVAHTITTSAGYRLLNQLALKYGRQMSFSWLVLYGISETCLRVPTTGGDIVEFQNLGFLMKPWN